MNYNNDDFTRLVVFLSIFLFVFYLTITNAGSVREVFTWL